MYASLLNRHLFVIFSLFLSGLQPVIAGGPGDADAGGILESYWWVEDIAGAGVVDNSHVTMGFMADGRVAGDTGCNRFMGNAAVEGEKMEFGPLAGTRKACAPALMNQENRFFQAVEQVASWRVAETGLLHLLNEQGETVIRAVAIDQDEL